MKMKYNYTLSTDYGKLYDILISGFRVFGFCDLNVEASYSIMGIMRYSNGFDLCNLIFYTESRNRFIQICENRNVKFIMPNENE